MAHTPGYRDEMAPSLTTGPSRVFSELVANPWADPHLVATNLPVDQSKHAIRLLRRSRHCAPLPPRDGFLPARALADPFGSPRRFPAQLCAFAALRKSFALRASHNTRAIRVALPQWQPPHACGPAC